MVSAGDVRNPDMGAGCSGRKSGQHVPTIPRSQYASLAQLVRAQSLHLWGREFESLRTHDQESKV
jgi:hypothetical protein